MLKINKANEEYLKKHNANINFQQIKTPKPEHITCLNNRMYHPWHRFTMPVQTPHVKPKKSFESYKEIEESLDKKISW